MAEIEIDRLLTRIAALERRIAHLEALDTPFIAGALVMREITAPVGTANRATLYAEDNGGGKTKLMCIFGTGVAHQIEIEL
jgi:hypothetical protein